MQALENTCKNDNIEFDKYDRHVHCIAHILNLSIQDALTMLKAGEIKDENELIQEQDGEEFNEIIPKVNQL